MTRFDRGMPLGYLQRNLQHQPASYGRLSGLTVLRTAAAMVLLSVFVVLPFSIQLYYNVTSNLIAPAKGTGAV